ncbi:cyclophilin-like protein [Ceraceosorus guamensis]|uniref:Peptidyl-prolyl cis-trans isomerase n=1 Tax=Ceraceosorus guamensis TaxID=1522189 RepID=A0A316W1T4_9BASI|nr:cyclophilin-like protein [Ceraceosorus guamensis]PWN43826.1 cyclophilin-like protein [Ceraceosorus guamensis]
MSNIYNTEPAPSARVVMSTSAGDLDIELWAKETPLASRNFLQLAMEGYYDGTTFHRLVQGFIIQGGDASGAGDGGESIYGQPFADEPHQRLRLNRRGLLACANEGERDSNTSQFFFTLDATPELQGRHTMFGRITGPTIYNLLTLASHEVQQGTDTPVQPAPKVLTVKVLEEPWGDVKPRITREERAEQERARRVAKKERAREREKGAKGVK